MAAFPKISFSWSSRRTRPRAAPRVLGLPYLDADTLAARGEVGTTSPEGTSKWGRVFTHAREVLAGVTVMVVQNMDEPGVAHARDVLASLRREPSRCR